MRHALYSRHRRSTTIAEVQLGSEPAPGRNRLALGCRNLTKTLPMQVFEVTDIEKTLSVFQGQPRMSARITRNNRSVDGLHVESGHAREVKGVGALVICRKGRIFRRVFRPSVLPLTGFIQLVGAVEREVDHAEPSLRIDKHNRGAIAVARIMRIPYYDRAVVEPPLV